MTRVKKGGWGRDETIGLLLFIHIAGFTVLMYRYHANEVLRPEFRGRRLSTTSAPVGTPSTASSGRGDS